MYSQELQTCDWPRNVGCDGTDIAPSPSTPSTPPNSRQKEEYTRTRYTPPPPPKPSALVISRGQPRQQQIYHDEEINLKQQQLYQDSEESLPEAQEEESDRQQRFYRGQPSTIGQVQRDRDGLRQSNAIAYHTGQKEKIGVISFGIHQNQDRQRVETTTAAPEPVSLPARTIATTSQYSASSYAPYDYDDKAKYEYNSYNEPEPSVAPVSYRSRTPAPTYQSVASQDDLQSSKRANVIQNDYVRGVYQEQSLPEYHDVTYDNAEDDHNSYRHSSRQPVRKESNLIEDQPSTSKSKNRITATYTSSTSRYSTKKTVKTPTPTISYKQNTVTSSASTNSTNENESKVYLKQSQYLEPGNSKVYTLSTSSLSKNTQHNTDIPQLSATEPSNNDVISPINSVKLNEPISLHSIQTSYQIPVTYRFITKKPPSKSTDQVSFSGTPNKQRSFTPETTTSASTHQPPSSKLLTNYDHISFIIPTTYSPPKFYFDTFLTKNLLSTSPPPKTKGTGSNYPRSFFPQSTRKTHQRLGNYQNDYITKTNKAVKFTKKIIPLTPAVINHELSSSFNTGAKIQETSSESIELPKSTSDFPSTTQRYTNKQKYQNIPLSFQNIDSKFHMSSTETVGASTSKTTVSTTPIVSSTTQRYSFKPKAQKLPSSSFRVNTASLGINPYSKPQSGQSDTKIISEIPSLQSDEEKSSISDQDQLILDKLNRYRNSSLLNPNYVPKTKVFQGTVEVPPLKSLLSDQDSEKEEPDLPPTYKLKPFKLLTKNPQTKTEYSLNATTPRISRINPAFKFMMNSFRGTKGHNTKCKESTPIQICSDLKQLRTNNRGRGHYTSGNVITNDVTVNSVNVNRGTPPPRSRPTLKPSTSIVSKAQEFVDIYRYPPRRPYAIYPQPQPDKTAAKCRKDVCLLPDCNCGGKDIPGDIPAEQVPQIVLLTFDDSVNDLNKGLYQDLFERGRVNPNGCPISATFYVSHEWTDYSQVQNLYSDGHEIASHTVSHSFGEQFSQKKWTREVAGQREILAAYGGVHLEDIRGMRAPFLSVGGNKMFKMLYDSNFTYDSSMPIYENKPPSWPYTLDYKLFHDCMIPPCPTRSYPGVWEVPMVMWQDLNGGRCSMGDACSNPADAEGVHKMIMKNFQRHYTTNRAPFGLFYHAAWFTQPHHKEGFINFLDNILAMRDVWVLTNWQAVQWVRDPTPTSRLGSFKPFQCEYSDRPKRCNNPKVCNLWHKSGVRYMRTCQPCPDIYPWTGNSGIRSSRIDNDIED
ncbi:hypothetical protein HHI36_023586 [Cryptolaemus montrouzieri]|uniref:NodB homology domain-containing protein n=1 Tax=Cryptolaemus montrouzieri TaxID=559131 RepID=A0ABD2PHH8_9CUCU